MKLTSIPSVSLEYFSSFINIDVVFACTILFIVGIENRVSASLVLLYPALHFNLNFRIYLSRFFPYF